MKAKLIKISKILSKTSGVKKNTLAKQKNFMTHLNTLFLSLSKLAVKYNFVVLLIAILGFFSSCKKNENDGGSAFNNRSTAAGDYAASSKPVVTVSGDITSTTTWSSSNVYEISGIVTVRSGATLNIQAGTYIKSTVNSGTANGVLVIAKDGEINAIGTQNNPIVFTSRYLLDGNDATKGKPGDFGGVIILGSDSINVAGRDKLIEGLPDESKFHYGGTDSEHYSGTFQYVRIEYAGYRLAENIEVNGLTLGGVGVNTVIDHVQVSYGLDDGFEFFGGTVSPTHLISLAADDDQFDFDNGFKGEIQYAIAIADKDSTHSTSGSPASSDSNGIESDNNAPAEDASYTLLPKTHPILSNFTIIGTESLSGISGLGYKYGIRERRGSEISIDNSIVTGYPSGVVFDSGAQGANAALSTISNTSIHGFSASLVGSPLGTGRILATVPNIFASTFNIVQPFFNVAGLNLTNTVDGRGALPNGSANWTLNWTKFNY